MARGSRRPGLFSGLRAGLWLLPEGLGFLRRHRALWPLAAVPVGFALLCVGGMATFFLNQVDVVHAFFVAALPVLEVGDWWHWIWVGPGRVVFFVLGWLGVLLSLGVGLIASLLVANLASAPFLDALSERVERIARGGVAAEGGSLLEGALSSFASELGRLAFLGSVWIGLTLAGFLLPGLHLVTGSLLLVVTISFLPLDYAGFALDRRSLPFRARRAWLAAHRPTLLGFGAVAFWASLVPGLNLVLMPSLVTAATLFVVRTRPEDQAGPGGARDSSGSAEFG